MKIKSILGGAVVTACALFPHYAAAQDDIPEMTLRWGHFAPDAWGTAKAEQLFAKEVEERTNGKVKMKIYWNGAIGGFGELMELVQDDAIDIASFVPTYHPAQWPLVGLTNSLPMVWDNVSVAMDVQKYHIEHNPYVQQELDDNGLKVLMVHGLPPYRLQCTQPVRTLADLEGLRIRTFGDWPPYVMEKLGAVPVSIPLGEVYEGLQRGTIDCGYNPDENAGFLKLYEVAPYWSDINFGAIAAYSVFTSQKTWDSWPESLKQIMQEAAEVAYVSEKENFEPLAQIQLDAAKSAGMERIHFEEQAELNAMFPDMLTVWQDSMCERGMCEAAKSVVADTKAVMEQAK